MKITSCLHTAILVSDLNKAEQFYGNILGLSKSSKRTSNFLGAWYQIGEHQLHIIVRPDFEAKIHNMEKWGRNAHVAFTVDDLNTAKQKLQDQGHPIQMSSSGRAAFFTLDPDNNIIELSQVNQNSK
ncbi:VOC family protein [Myxosarcina sp. GI1]|uniref:VOC family protein n=1 Tax=Myxosarcina sp. GI1 TaxID=1541065 RepID=UPI0005622024|nr:VOC family protein [Myxosarcina sp. GI1]